MIPLAPYPSDNVRSQIPQTQWTYLVGAWLFLIRRLLSSPPEDAVASFKETSVVLFLVSFVQHASLRDDIGPSDVGNSELKKQCFLLLHRALAECRPVPDSLLQPSTLARASRLYRRKQSFRNILENLWTQQDFGSHKSFATFKASLISSLETPDEPSDINGLLQNVTALAKASPSFARFLLMGSDFVDALSSAYVRSKHTNTQRQLVTLAHVCLAGIMRAKGSATSLMDHLYSLQGTSVMKTIVERTSFLGLFKEHVASLGPDAPQAKLLLESFSSYERTLGALSGKRKRKVDKGKRRADASGPSDADDIMHVHHMSLISQIQDLFPDLSTDFVLKLLDEYGGDTEQVIAHVLDDNLPSNLQHEPQAEPVGHPQPSSDYELVPNLAPHATPPLPPTRRNIYDDDDFDRLAIDTSKLHIGRRNADLTADRLLAARKPSNDKAAILSALATFDADDDERDDTYDVADVGGTIDTTFEDTKAEMKEDKNEEALFNIYQVNKDAFKRDGETRRSRLRLALKDQTNLTDEAIEGWAIMLGRDPKRLQRLQRLHETGLGVQQQSLASSSWRDDAVGAADEHENGTPTLHSSDSGRGRGRGGRGRGGAVAGAVNDHSTQVARQRKDANKASRANHNRRDQRARKMARGAPLG